MKGERKMENASLFKIILMVTGFVFVGMVVTFICAAIKTVRQQTIAIIERFGKFHREAQPGLTAVIPFVDKIVGRPSLKVLESIISVETKTKDNVFVTIKISVQYQITQSKVQDAFYKLSNPEGQIKSYVFDVIRGNVPEQDLDDLFQAKDTIANAVKTKLEPAMKTYGYEVVTVLVTDVDPDKKVKEAMNEINANQRLQVAAAAKGEADKIIVVKKAEGEKESKKLQGEGIALERLAIATGFKDSIEILEKATGANNAREVMNMLLLTQHYDTLQKIGTGARSTVLLTPYSPGSMNNIVNQFTEALLMNKQVPADEATKIAAPGSEGK